MPSTIAAASGRFPTPPEGRAIFSRMAHLFHHPLCPHSRFVRLALAEYGFDTELIEELAHERREDFLVLNPAGQTPVLVADGGLVIPGASNIAEWLDEAIGPVANAPRLLPADVAGRVETRRLLDWFNQKFFAEVTEWLVHEKVTKRFLTSARGGGAPDMHLVRAARSNIRYHLHYIGHLAGRRNWLAGDRMTFRRSGGGGASVGRRLSRRRAVGRGRTREGMVPADQIAALVPPAAGRPDARDGAERDLRRPRLLKDRLAAEARALGFDVMRVTRPDAAPALPARLAEWLQAGRHGTMDWLETTAGRRADPRVLWPQVRSVVMLGMNYGPDDDPRAIFTQRDRGAISVYARNRDYHDLMKGRLKLLAGKLVAFARQDAEAEPDVKVFVDTAPVMEKPLAMAAGLGWQGKHTNLVSREFGSWLFLGALFTTLELDAHPAEVDHCGSCRACVDACPTKAFPAPFQIDARRCISYLTIENKGPIPHEFRAAIGNRIYGCDDCLAACPWNKFAQVSREAKLVARDELRAPSLAVLARLDDAKFRGNVLGQPDQADRRRALPAQCAHRHRQQRRVLASARRA